MLAATLKVLTKQAEEGKELFLSLSALLFFLVQSNLYDPRFLLLLP